MQENQVYKAVNIKKLRCVLFGIFVKTTLFQTNLI